jgi:coniferyl-aldehyde dehydrogenase
MVTISRLEEPAQDTAPSELETLKSAFERLRRAHRAQPAPSYAERIDALERLERALLAKKEDFASAVSADFGQRSRHETLLAEVFVTLQGLRYAKRHLRRWMQPERREVSWVFAPGTARVVHQPLGVVGIISPWNYPLQLAIAPLVGALAAGNRALIKPSELTPRTSEQLCLLVGEAFPREQVDVVPGGPALGDAFARLPFDHLVFTGSTRVGRLVAKAAAEQLTPLTLELGGKSPTILGPDADAATVAKRVMFGKLLNAGQTCIAPDYVFVPEAQRDAFVEGARRAVRSLYPTLADNPDYTAVINEAHYRRLEAHLADARQRGAEVLVLADGQERLDVTHRKFAPTLVLEPTEEMTVMQDELFGPILPVKTYRELGEAIAYVNDHPRPLALYYFGRRQADIDRVLTETICGGVTLNDTLLHVAQDDLPFGGVGASGMGHYHGFEGFETFSKKKPIFDQARLNTSLLLAPPFGKKLERLLSLLLR